MKIRIEKRHLLNMLAKTQNIVEKRNTMPVLINALLEASQGDNPGLKVLATDLEVSLKDFSPAEVIEPGRIAVHAKNFFDIVKELDEGLVSLQVTENNWIQIKQNNYFSKIVGVNAEEYPVFPVFNENDNIQIDPKLLKEMIDKTFYSVCNDERRYHLNGLFMEKKTKDGLCSFRMVATDGHRMSIIDRTTVESERKPIQTPVSVIIPRKGIMEIKKILDGTDMESVRLSIEGTQLVLSLGSTVLLIRLIEGRYPNYQQLIPQQINTHIQVNREHFLSSVRRVALMANQKSKTIQLSFAAGKLEISSNNPEFGDAKEEIDVEQTGENVKIGFNAKFVTDILTAMTEDKIDIEFKDQNSPGILRPHADSTYTCVIMPMYN